MQTKICSINKVPTLCIAPPVFEKVEIIFIDVKITKCYEEAGSYIDGIGSEGDEHEEGSEGVKLTLGATLNHLFNRQKRFIY